MLIWARVLRKLLLAGVAMAALAGLVSPAHAYTGTCQNVTLSWFKVPGTSGPATHAGLHVHVDGCHGFSVMVEVCLRGSDGSFISPRPHTTGYISTGGDIDVGLASRIDPNFPPSYSAYSDNNLRTDPCRGR